MRITPAHPVAAYQTYTASAPLATHWRPASCAEVDCEAHLHGWRTVVDERTDLGMGQAAWIRSDCRPVGAVLAPGARDARRYLETRDGDLTVFTFPAGQTCFAAGDHMVPLERPPLFLVRGGDWRGNPTGMVRHHARPEDWVEDFATHQQRVADAHDHG